MAQNGATNNYGSKPFVFRDQWSFFRYPFLFFGSIPVVQFWEDRPEPSVLDALTDEEKAYIGTNGQLGLDAFMTINKAFFPTDRTLLPRHLLFRLIMARTDLYTTVALLKYVPDELWNPLFHAHQAAEKALKVYLLSHGHSSERLRKRHGHNLKTLLADCADHDQRFSRWPPLLESMAWDQDWRYTPYEFPKQVVVNMFDGAIILLADVVDALLPTATGYWPTRVSMRWEQ
jgi:hypothetical protein